MRWVVMFPLVLILSCCDTPGLRHMGVAPLQRSVGGMSFDIRVRDNLAEAIRTNSMWRPRMSEVAKNGSQAIAQATGCHVAWVRGDPSVLLAGLDCKDGRPVPRQPRRRTFCAGTVSTPDSRGESDVIFSCR